MPVFRSIVFTAALAGLLAGVLLTVLQQLGTMPLIARAETYGQAPAPPTTASIGHAHDHAGGGAWAPQDGLERTGFTLLANIVTGVAFALLLVAGLALAGRPVDWRQGLLWGIGGFAVFALAPSFGLPPELPGMAAAPLGPRQVWWAATAIATAAGLGLLAFRREPLWVVVAVTLLVAPHLVCAPEPGDHTTLVPEGLARQFVVTAVVTSFLFWLALGVLSAVLFARFAAHRGLARAG